MDLADLMSILEKEGDASVRAGMRVRLDSRTVCPGDIFVVMQGTKVDGQAYVQDAVDRGARFVISEKPVELPSSSVNVVVKGAAEAAARVAHGLCGYPGRRLINLGVTGTNGKTTVAFLTQAMMQASGRLCGLLGTVHYDLLSRRLRASHTTPDAPALAQLLAEIVDAGAEAAVMECSSHALVQNRLHSIDFQAAAFTNLSGDHLDYHGSYRQYRDAKRLLFDSLDKGATAVVNADDPESDDMVKDTSATVWRYSLTVDAELSGKILRQDRDLSRWRLRLGGSEMDVATSLIGRFNLSNALAAAGLALAVGVTPDGIAQALETFVGVPGRLERVDVGQPFTVLIDYAHTDDALEKVLEQVRQICSRELILVFGCGGSRDRSKRPRMAAAAQRFADQVILTDDNPRDESSEQILNDIMAGFSGSFTKAVQKCADRRGAIAQALEMADAGDVVLIAGKGHEDYQEINRQRIAFDDLQVCRDILGGKPSIAGESMPVAAGRRDQEDWRS